MLVTAALLLAVELLWLPLGDTFATLAPATLLIAVGCGLFHPTLIALHAMLLPGEPGRATSTFYIGFDLGIGAGSWLLSVVLDYAGFHGLYVTAALVVLGIVGLVPGLAGRQPSMPS